jgi:NADH:ubiquinone oxidoreductase subunit C
MEPIRNQMFDAHGLSKDLRDVAIPEEPEVHPLGHDFPYQKQWPAEGCNSK